MIKLQAIGHLGKDATKNEVNGKAVINFSIAHTESFKDSQGNKKDKTVWIDCARWTDQTGILPYLAKGTQVYVEGQPEVRTWEKDGKSGASLSLRVNTIQLLGGGNKDNVTAENTPVYGAKGNSEVLEPIDDLPF